MTNIPPRDEAAEIVRELREIAKWQERVANNMRGDPEDAYDRAAFLERAAAFIESRAMEATNAEIAAVISDDIGVGMRWTQAFAEHGLRIIRDRKE